LYNFFTDSEAEGLWKILEDIEIMSTKLGFDAEDINIDQSCINA